MVFAEQPLPPLHQKESGETLQTPAELFSRMLVPPRWEETQFWGPELCEFER